MRTPNWDMTLLRIATAPFRTPTPRYKSSKNPFRFWNISVFAAKRDCDKMPKCMEYVRFSKVVPFCGPHKIDSMVLTSSWNMEVVSFHVKVTLRLLRHTDKQKDAAAFSLYLIACAVMAHWPLPQSRSTSVRPEPERFLLYIHAHTHTQTVKTQNACLCPCCLPLSLTLIFLSSHLLMRTHRHSAFKQRLCNRAFISGSTPVCPQTHPRWSSLYRCAVHPLTSWSSSTGLRVMTKCTLTDCQRCPTGLLAQHDVRACVRASV